MHFREPLSIFFCLTVIVEKHKWRAELQIVFSDCPDDSHWFACSNGQCLPHHMLCDGLKHCEDGSDEIELCGRQMQSIPLGMCTRLCLVHFINPWSIYIRYLSIIVRVVAWLRVMAWLPHTTLKLYKLTYKLFYIPKPGPERRVSCQFHNQYICGYDTNQYSGEDGIWKWKNDGGFNLQNGTWAKGSFFNSY